MNLTLDENIKAAREYLSPDDVDCVVYHNPCNDGSGAAIAAWLHLGDKAIYEPRAYHKEFKYEALRDKNVVVLDASFNQEDLLYARTIARKLMIVDHHVTAMHNLADFPGCFFTMENSGAILAWHYFHGVETPAPALLRLIEDRDLWRWQERELSEPLYYALRERCNNHDFKSYLPYIDADKLDELIDYGNTLVASNHKWCENAAKKIEHKTFVLPDGVQEYKIMCGELSSDKLVSELAEYLYKHNHIDFVMLWTKTKDGQYKVSFRSQEGAADVSAIAEALGGGGHVRAAGAVLNTSPWQLTV